ncbi:MAG: DUF86 domain-containing protein [Alphaproteobacteria bacterium]|nr:DUF86 domain-containing protein [Alphaproteobacteria bacterium]
MSRHPYHNTRDWKLRIADMAIAVERIQEYSSGMTYDDFMESQRTIDAVIRNLEIIGEAAGKVSGKIKSRYSRVPWDKLKIMRNLLIHEYFDFGQDAKIIWETVCRNIPDIAHALHRLQGNENIEDIEEAVEKEWERKKV